MMAGINELMKRYNITTAQGMTRTIRVHLDELNADGEHARKIGKEWQLDAVAIRRLDSIRGLSKSRPSRTSKTLKFVASTKKSRT